MTPDSGHFTKLFQQLVVQNPNVPRPRYPESLADAYLNAGKTYFATSRWNEAVTSLEKWKSLSAARNPP